MIIDRVRACAVAAAVVLTAACSPASQPAAPAAAPTSGTAAKPVDSKPAASTGQRQTIRLAVSQTDSNFYSPIFIALKEGFYSEAGIELDVKPRHFRRLAGRDAEDDLRRRRARTVLDHHQARDQDVD
jgi:hypothetical protein